MLIPNCYCVTEWDEWLSWLSAAVGPWGDPFGWSSANTLCNLFLMSHPTQIRDQENLPLHWPVIIQINYQNVDCLNLTEQCRADNSQHILEIILSLKF